jgi:hypothetical protein
MGECEMLHETLFIYGFRAMDCGYQAAKSVPLLP